MVDHRDHLRKGEDAKIGVSLVAGAGSGLVARFATAPMDTVKIRSQITPGSGSPMDVVTRIMRSEGLRGLWRGNVPGSLMYVVYGGVQFSTYAFYNSALSPLRWNDQLHSLVVGGLAGMSSSLASYPFDVLRTRLVASGELATLRAAVRQICIEDGIPGLFKGCVASVVTITLATSVLFCTYETVKICAERCDPGRGSVVLDAAASPLAGLVSKLATFPLDTARRRLLLSNATSHHNFKTYSRRPLLAVATHIAQREGYRALYQGCSMALLKSVPSTAISLWTYQWLMSAVGG
ncbi:hypothetical protein HG537_0D02220 [Torulaspora globosa]|uniref:Mitochondrial thiamine pyrophosphate carrier 1 n=1 Tax=Torulaspora globosa TaxID=48254 RepID=A0A7H9HSD4_9SACH|nr:hypothetical protein HG537_0D02220 [Torulaspora sp. CBS 2947]